MYHKALYVVFHGFAEHSGITKKIRSQVAALTACGVSTQLCSFEVSSTGEQVIRVDERDVYGYGTGFLGKIRKRYDFRALKAYIVHQGIDFVYVRHFVNSNLGLVLFARSLRRAGVCCVLEVPTFPYDREFSDARFVDKLLHLQDYLFRRMYVGYMAAVVTFSQAEVIFGQRTIRISNGVDFESIPLRSPHPADPAVIRLVSVSEMHYWHGLDRVLYGLKAYYSTPQDVTVVVDFVGKPDTVAGRALVELATQLGLASYVRFLGPLYGSSLDAVFDEADVAIGSLGRHRSGIREIKTLKNREYAARGIPFLYSELDSDFEAAPYVFKVSADELPLSISSVVDFYLRHYFSPHDIRESVLDKLSWKEQMRQVLLMLNP